MSDVHAFCMTHPDHCGTHFFPCLNVLHPYCLTEKSEEKQNNVNEKKPEAKSKQVSLCRLQFLQSQPARNIVVEHWDLFDNRLIRRQRDFNVILRLFYKRWFIS